jgi:hypothetical protein
VEGRRQNSVDLVGLDAECFRDLGRSASGLGSEVFAYVWPEVGSVAVTEPVAFEMFREGQAEGGAVKNPGRLGQRFARCVAAVKARGGAYDPAAVCAAAGRRKYGKREMAQRAAAGRKRASRNPAAAAAEASEGFHGRPVEEVIEVAEQVHYHQELADCGELVDLLVLSGDGGRVRLSGFDGARLAFNEDRNQLFVVGGDQYVEVESFGLAAEAHEVERLGHVVRIAYHTVKHHLGAEGGDADYVHDFGEETLKEEGAKKPSDEDLRRVCPELLYRYRDAQLVFAGGLYTVEDEGIRN